MQKRQLQTLDSLWYYFLLTDIENQNAKQNTSILSQFSSVLLCRPIKDESKLNIQLLRRNWLPDLGIPTSTCIFRRSYPSVLLIRSIFKTVADNDCSASSFTACICEGTFLVFFKCWCKFRARRSHHRPLLSVQYTSWDRRVCSSSTASCSNMIVSLLMEIENQVAVSLHN